MIDLTGVYAILTILLGIVSCYLTYKQLKIQKTLKAASEYVKIHDKITALSSREKTVELLSEINDRAKKGDIVFGHCRVCTAYPNEFFISLSEAVKICGEPTVGEICKPCQMLQHIDRPD